MGIFLSEPILSANMKLALFLCGVMALVLAEACRDKWEDYCAESDNDLCYYKDFRNDCCAKCAALKTDVEGCEYGDHVPWCNEFQKSDCESRDLWDQCCATLCAKTLF